MLGKSGLCVVRTCGKTPTLPPRDTERKGAPGVPQSELVTICTSHPSPYGGPDNTVAVCLLHGGIWAPRAPQSAPVAPFRVQAFPVLDLREVFSTEVCCLCPRRLTPQPELTPWMPEIHSSATSPHTVQRRCSPTPPGLRQHLIVRELATNALGSRNGALVALHV